MTKIFYVLIRYLESLAKLHLGLSGHDLEWQFKFSEVPGSHDVYWELKYVPQRFLLEKSELRQDQYSVNVYGSSLFFTES